MKKHGIGFCILLIFLFSFSMLLATNDSLLTQRGTWAVGSSYSVAAQHKFAYCGVGHYFKIFNFHYRSVVEYGQLALNTTVGEIKVVGDYAYVVNDTAGLVIIDVTNADPVKVGQYCVSQFYHAHDVVVSGNYAYLAYGGLGLKIIDVSDPTHPTEIGSSTATTACYSVDVEGSFAYITDFYGKLYIIDISDPASPVQSGYYNAYGIYYEHIDISGNYACIAGGTEGLRILNVGKRDSIYEVGFYDTPDRAVNITVKDDLAYLADRDNGLMIFDISTPDSPTLDYHFDTEGWARDIALDGDSILIADESKGIRVLYWSWSDSLIDGTHYDPGDKLTGVSVTESGYLAYVSDIDDGMFTLDMQNKDFLKMGTLSEGFVGGNSIAHTGSYAYVGDDYKNLHIIDVTYRSHQPVLNVDTLLGVPTAMHIEGDYLYVTMGLLGMSIYDITDRENPVNRGYIDTDNYAKNVDVQGSYAYVSDNTNGYYIIDISDPENPTIVTRIQGKGWVQDIAVKNNYLFVAEYGSGLRVYDVADTSHIVAVDSFSIGAYAMHVEICGNYVSVVFQNTFTYREALYLFDVTDPTNIKLAYTHELWGVAAAQDLKMTTGFIYVPMYCAGLYIYEYQIPTKISDMTVPQEYKLLQNYPNPFNPETTINYSLPFESDVEVYIHDLKGRKIAMLYKGKQEAGIYKLNWNGGHCGSGIYLAVLKANGKIVGTNKMLLVK